MAGTTDTSSGSKSRGRTSSRGTASPPTPDDLQKQIEQLQIDIKVIADTLRRMGEAKAGEAQGRAREEYAHLREAGEHVYEEVSEEFADVERQLKRTIRRSPFAAVAGALGIGFLLALLTR